MHVAPRFPRPRAGLRGVLALTPAAIAAPITIVLLSASGSTATTTSEYAAYPALKGTGPTDLTLVASHDSKREGDRPTWPIQAPEGAQSGWPTAESIRKLQVASPGITAWIAKSLGGGVCVLLWAHQPAGEVPSIGYSCSGESEEELQQGATAQVSEIPGEPGKVYVAGVLPSTASAVSVTLADGTSETVPVSDNAWSLEAEGEPQSYHTIPAGG
jgi:hypothetical protein